VVYTDGNNNGVIEPTEILEAHHYYPFGLEHQNYSTITGNTEYKYTFGGKEFQPEKDLNMYDFGARNYDPALGRWMNVDPLAEQFQGWTPYNYTLQNPVNLTDPTGMAPEGISPIYGLNGKFLGTDDEGFNGEILFMDEKVFNSLGGFNNGTDGSKKGSISHNTAKSLSRTLNQVISSNPEDNFSQSESDMINNAITHVVSQMSDASFYLGGLINGKTSTSFSSFKENPESGLDIFSIKSNYGSRLSIASESPASVTANHDKFTIHLKSSLWRKEGQFTVGNIQNISVHELIGHIGNKIPGGGNLQHLRAYDLQMKHPTWKNTTPEYRKFISEGRNLIQQVNK